MSLSPVLCPRQDSNLRTSLRRRVLYPLSYGGSERQPRVIRPPKSGGVHHLCVTDLCGHRGSRSWRFSIGAMATAAKTVLVCDDDPIILRLLRVNMEVEGYDVLQASNGEEAVQVASANHPDLVIMDIMMPRMDGYQACRALKADETTRDIPIVFLSAKVQQSDIEKGLAYGVEEYLTKPFDPSDLLEVVDRLIHR